MQELDIVQNKWLRLLQQAQTNEVAVGELYQQYAELFPEQLGTWGTLARAEAVHAKLLQSLIDNKEVLSSVVIPFDKLNSNTMEFITGQVAVMREKATAGAVTIERAVTNSLLLESSLVENFLYTAAPPNSEFSAVAERLAKDSQYHRKMVEKLRDTLGTARHATDHEVTQQLEAVNAQPFVPVQVESVQPEPSMATVSRLSASSVIGGMARHEECVGQLYRAYAARFPAMADFWNDLAAEELGHAECIRMIGKRIQSGELGFTPERFELDTIRMSTEFVETQIVVIRREKIEETQALTVAKTIEEKSIEAYAFSIFTEDSAAPELRTAFSALHEQDRKHRERIDQKIAELSGGVMKTIMRRLFHK